MTASTTFAASEEGALISNARSHAENAVTMLAIITNPMIGERRADR